MDLLNVVLSNYVCIFMSFMQLALFQGVGNSLCSALFYLWYKADHARVDLSTLTCCMTITMLRYFLYIFQDNSIIVHMLFSILLCLFEIA